MVISSKFLDALTPSSIRSITAKIRDKAKDGIQVVSFAGGLPSKEFFPLEDLRRITDQVFDEEGGEAIQYAASDGYDPLRQYLVEFMKRYQVNNIDYKNILITSGAQQGLAYLAKGMIEPGSVVVVENPSYPGALDTFRSYGAEIVGVGMDDDGMKMDALEQVLQAGKVNHFHACANNRGAPGQGVIPWEDLLGLLVRYGYGGHITMETFALGGLDSSWVQVHSEPDELAREGLFYLQAFFKTKAGL